MENTRKQILVADDDFDYLEQMKIYIESFGYEFIKAESQKECEELLETLKPDLAILDLMMENEDSGFILAYKIKKMHEDVPVIIATSVSAETGINFDNEANSWIKADKMMEKGIRADQLKREIDKLLNI
ncbi:MAG: response regulator [Bacteroidota bacterium]|nr:response regulator [Bacteroidota bacterium]